jgi:CBS domain containing-hemolysin-like protein
MTRRTEMITMAADLPIDSAARFVAESRHTRVPIFQGGREEIVGIVHAKDLLAELSKAPHERRPLVEIARKPYFVPETKAIDELLEQFQQSQNHIAVVIDEFGGVSGLLTIEDVLEEIVGEIADEHDEALADGIKRIDERASEALARVRISEINERLGLSLPDEEHFDTIGGFVFHELGRIPHAGEELTHGDVRIRVLAASRRRIDRVRIEVLQPEVATAAEKES